MIQSQFAIWGAVGLFVGMLSLLELGRRLGQRRSLKDAEGARSGLGAIEGAIFGLMGLLLAFTFSGAAIRFDLRRNLIVQEANAIGTAWLRLDLLPASAQPPLREALRRYLDARLAVYAKLPDLDAARAALAEANALQLGIWEQAVAACQTEAGRPATMLVLPALNEVFDLANTRTMATQTHPPNILYVMLGTLSLVAALLAGYGLAGGRSRSWIHILGFAAIMATTVYIIIDYEFPRLGSIRVDAFDQALRDVRQAMETPKAPP